MGGFAVNKVSILLHGPRGAGKSTLGPLLADDMDLPFFDLDRLVESRAGLRIHEIVDTEDWERFRSLERRVFDDLMRRNSGAMVLAVGGGFVAEGERLGVLRQRFAQRIWLDLPPAFQADRILDQTSQRPKLTQAANWDQEFAVLDRQRRPLDEALATLRVDATPPVQVLRASLNQHLRSAD
ncbi:MAG: hypothetical protein CMH55_09545 [Myxococcales bacterium]|nr:hypothetical protein [Myxococcales bacterium]